MPATVAIKLGVGLIRSFSLSTMMGKKDFVVAPFVVLSHSMYVCLSMYMIDSNYLRTTISFKFRVLKAFGEIKT
jgi:hypothetical protein